MSTAFVLSGGASHGAVQVGMLQALHAHGVQADVVVGTSAGALNAAWVAGDPDLSRLRGLESVWSSLSAGKVFKMRALDGLLGALGRRSALAELDGLRSILLEQLPYELFEDASIPLHVMATDLLTGTPRRLSSGNAIDAILASAAIPGMFPAVEIDGRLLVDGGLTSHTPLSFAAEMSIDTIYVLSTGYACALSEPPSNPLAMAVHSLTIMFHAQLLADVKAYRGSAQLRVLPPLCPVNVSPIDFSQCADLIARSRLLATQYLDADSWGDGTEHLGLHDHDNDAHSSMA